MLTDMGQGTDRIVAYIIVWFVGCVLHFTETSDSNSKFDPQAVKKIYDALQTAGRTATTRQVIDMLLIFDILDSTISCRPECR